MFVASNFDPNVNQRLVILQRARNMLLSKLERAVLSEVEDSSAEEYTTALSKVDAEIMAALKK